MARIRRLKPEIWQSADFTRLALLGRLAFIVMITQADDEGRLRTNAHHLALAYFHDASLTTDIEGQLNLMARLGMIQRYRDSQNEFCVSLINFASHQVIERPTASRIDKPPETSVKPRRILGERSVRTQHGEREGRKESKEREESKSHSPAAHGGDELALVGEISRGPVEHVFEEWKAATGRTGRTQLDRPRRRFIEAALKVYSLEDVVDAVRGWRHSPHHRGENDRATVYNDLDLLLRNSKQIEYFRDLERNAPSTHAAGSIHPLDRWAHGVITGRD